MFVNEEKKFNSSRTHRPCPVDLYQLISSAAELSALASGFVVVSGYLRVCADRLQVLKPPHEAAARA